MRQTLHVRDGFLRVDGTFGVVPLDQVRGTIFSASTAEGAAANRAAGSKERDPEVRNPDFMAREFVPLAFRASALSKFAGFRRIYAWGQRRLIPGLYYFELARTKHFDATLVREVSAGAGQLVLLGPGYDSRPYRFSDCLRDRAVFEVDHPVNLFQKQARLRHVFGTVPREVTYVAADFDVDPLPALLSAAGYDASIRTLFQLCGVTAFLTPAGIENVLGVVAANSNAESMIVFDYVPRSAIEDENPDCYGAKENRRFCARLGEPIIFGIKEGELPLFLQARGLELVKELLPDELAQRYLTRTDGRLHGRPTAFPICSARPCAKARNPAPGHQATEAANRLHLLS